MKLRTIINISIGAGMSSLKRPDNCFRVLALHIEPDSANLGEDVMILNQRWGFTFGLVAGEYVLLCVASRSMAETNNGEAMFGWLSVVWVADPPEVGECQ